MTGFYVWNNIGIAFRCFATGVLFGLGSVFFLVYNGLTIGAVAGLVTAAGHGKNLLTFTCTHGAFELTAIVISATAGMVMGYALVDTRGRTRFGSLRARGRDIVYLVMGAALMLAVAALIEGFWSPSGVPARVKWGTAIAAYALVISYLTFAGVRARAVAPAPPAHAPRPPRRRAREPPRRARGAAPAIAGRLAGSGAAVLPRQQAPAGRAGAGDPGTDRGAARVLRLARALVLGGAVVPVRRAVAARRGRVHRRARRAAVQAARRDARADVRRRASCAASPPCWSPPSSAG